MPGIPQTALFYFTPLLFWPLILWRFWPLILWRFLLLTVTLTSGTSASLIVEIAPGYNFTFHSGPSHYVVEDKGTAKKSQKTSSVFASSTNRIKTPTPLINVSLSD